MTAERMVELMEIEHQCMLRASHGDCDGKCHDCDLVQDDGELHEMYTDVIALLKEQEAVEPKVSSSEQRCGNCNKVIEMDGWQACPWCGKRIDWNGWWKKNDARNQDTRIVR